MSSTILFVHQQFNTGSNYYRLKQIDHNGRFDYSKTVAVEMDRSTTLSNYFYPNPSLDGSIELRYTAIADSEISIEVFDITGRFLLGKKLDALQGTNSFSFDFNELGTGTFMIRIVNEGLAKTHKLVLN